MNGNRHIYLYAKHWYKRTDIVEDLKIICAERCGCYSIEYNDVNNLEEVNKCKVSTSDVLDVMTNLVQKYMENDVNNYLFLEFVNGIAPWNTWKVGYLNKQCNVMFMSKKELEEAPEYDYIKAVLHKYCSMLSIMEVSKIKEIDNCELGEPDYKLFPMFKLEENKMLVNVDGVKYHVSWIHNPSLRFPSASTGCTIKVDTQIYATGVAMLSKKDNYNYDKGRKISLERALQKLFPITYSVPDSLKICRKTCRKTFWKEYFDMTRKDYLD